MSISVQQHVYEMLIENTGDDVYGCKQRVNKTKTLKDFRNEPVESFKRDGGQIVRTVSVFQYLTNFGLSIDKVSSRFTSLNREATDWDADTEVYGVSIEAWDDLTSNHEVEILRTFNTYNYEYCDLNQGIQGAHALVDGEDYIIVQIHNGCDERGGYTNARMFKWSLCEECRVEEYKSQAEILEEISSGKIKENQIS
jgi:hypothetical protein